MGAVSCDALPQAVFVAVDEVLYLLGWYRDPDFLDLIYHFLYCSELIVRQSLFDQIPHALADLANIFESSIADSKVKFVKM